MFARCKDRIFPRVAAFFALLLALAFVAASPAQAAPQVGEGPVGVQASPQLFGVMCALYASGFPAESTVEREPGFADLQTRLLGLHGPATEALRAFYRGHALGDPGATLSRYITFALILGPPPKFSLLLSHNDLPPDALALDGFSQVLANFYQEAGIEQLWKEFEPAYNKQVAGLVDPVSRIVQQESGYLRESPPEMSRNLVVYVEPLVGARSNARNVRNHYGIVVNPAADPLPQIRHTMLHFFLDPLPLRYFDQIHSGAPLLGYAAMAPRLPEELHADFSAYFTECLVQAVELRLRRLPPAEQARQLDQADGEGYVLLRPLVAALAKFEASEPSFTLYFPDLLRSINFPSEIKRAQTLTFLPTSEESPGGPADEPAETASSARAQLKLNGDLQKDLSEGERRIASGDPATAAEAFERVLKAMPGQPRAEYGLAVTYVLRGDLARARDLFEAVVTAPSSAGAGAPADPMAAAWSHIYLGRINDLSGDRSGALDHYRASLAIQGAPDEARAAAQRGIEQPYVPAKPAPKSQ